MSESATTHRGRVDQRIELRRQEAASRRASELMHRTGNVVDRHPFAIAFGAASFILILLYLMMHPGRLGWIPAEPLAISFAGLGTVAMAVCMSAYHRRRINWYIKLVLEENPCVYCGQSLRGIPGRPDENVICPECGHVVENSNETPVQD